MIIKCFKIMPNIGYTGLQWKNKLPYKCFQNIKNYMTTCKVVKEKSIWGWLYNKNHIQSTCLPPHLPPFWFLSHLERMHVIRLYIIQCQKKTQRKEHSQIILWACHHPDTETRQGYHKKRKLQTNITDEHRHKNPQQNT